MTRTKSPTLPRTKVLCALVDYNADACKSSDQPNYQIMDRINREIAGLIEEHGKDVRIKHQNITCNVNKIEGRTWVTLVALVTFEW
jgi:hypothetical protein